MSERAAQIARVPAERRLLVPVDVGKHEAMALVADGTGQRLVAPFTFTLDRPGLAALVGRVERVVSGRGDVQVEVGVEAAGHYHRPLTASASVPDVWTLIELNPAHVTEQRRVLGKRGIKTDQVDLAAMFDLLVVGRGHVINRRPDPLLELQAWAAMRHRRVGAVIAVKNQLLGQMDRAFPGVSRCVAGSLLDVKVGRLVIAEFSDPARLARLGPAGSAGSPPAVTSSSIARSPDGSSPLPGPRCRCKAPPRHDGWWPATCSCSPSSRPTRLRPRRGWPALLN